VSLALPEIMQGMVADPTRIVEGARGKALPLEEPKNESSDDPLARLSAYLINSGVLRVGDLERAQLLAAQTRTRLPSVLTRLGLLPDKALAEAFEAALGIERAADPLVPLDPLPAGLNPRFLERHQCVPLELDDHQLLAATSDPSNDVLRSGLAFALGRTITLQVAPEALIQRTLAHMNLAEDAAPLAAGNEGGLSLRADKDRLEDAGSDAPVVRLVQRLINDASNREASDIHIEALPRALIIRFRIDGDLQVAEELPDSYAAPVVSRIKVMAGLDIAEKRLPQDGRIRTSVEGENLDIRVSTTPTVHGEGVVMRLLGRNSVALDLDKLGLSMQAVEDLKAALAQPHGIILVTGPTGSGKTTTLYAALERLKAPTSKILTVEDPVEYIIPGVNQVQVKPDIGLTYASALRAFLRQDPDILLVGEIRDKETADIAIRAALTGHLVLSTLHTNTALDAFTRLIDMGVEPYLLASTVRLTAAQRLVRKLCVQCKVPRLLEASEAELFRAHAMPVPAHVYDTVGCPHCNMSGYKGRTPVIETVLVTPALAEMVRTDASQSTLIKATAQIHDALMCHALSLVTAGITTLSEIQSISANMDKVITD
jgi:general secretion pathway protein E